MFYTTLKQALHLCGSLKCLKIMSQGECFIAKRTLHLNIINRDQNNFICQEKEMEKYLSRKPDSACFLLLSENHLEYLIFPKQIIIP